MGAIIDMCRSTHRVASIQNMGFQHPQRTCVAYLSHPDLSSFFYVSVLVWSGRELGWAFYVFVLGFVFLC